MSETTMSLIGETARLLGAAEYERDKFRRALEHIARLAPADVDRIPEQWEYSRLGDIARTALSTNL